MLLRHEDIRNCTIALLQRTGVISAADVARKGDLLHFRPLHGDGSARRFFRVFQAGRALCIAVLPASSGTKEMAESRATVMIGSHLRQALVPVPAIIGEDSDRGLILFEDLGDLRLHDCLLQERSRGLAFYPEVIRQLVRMQVAGVVDFKQQWCYDGQIYDRALMREREAGYFLEAFRQQILPGAPVAGIEEEFADLADLAGRYFEPLFLHRDFQSRNIMITDDCVRIIDFQGGRLGPPGYDIASLLLDPYSALSPGRQERFFDLYLAEMKSFSGIDCERIRASYPYLALFRNLQIIGAFAYLAGIKQKRFFISYIMPALIALQNRLAENLFSSYPLLRQTVAEAVRLYRDPVQC